MSSTRSCFHPHRLLKLVLVVVMTALLPSHTTRAGEVHGSSNSNAGGNWAVVLAGKSNTAKGSSAGVVCGRSNEASGTRAVVVGGEDNKASDNNGIVGGGSDNTAVGRNAGILAGKSNKVVGDNASVGGGVSNTVGSNAGFVGGGRNNSVTGLNGAVLGGQSNAAGCSGCVVGGGGNNIIGGSINSYSTITGGLGNEIVDHLEDGSEIPATGTTITGGVDNKATGAGAVVGGGLYNHASGNGVTVPGGMKNLATADYSAAYGSYANATHKLSAVFSFDYQSSFSGQEDKYCNSQGEKTVSVCASNGFYVNGLDVEAAIEDLQTDKNQLERRASDLTEQVTTLTTENMKLQSQVSNLQVEVSSVQTEKAKGKDRMTTYHAQTLAQQSKKLKEHEQRLAAQEYQIQALRAQLLLTNPYISSMGPCDGIMYCEIDSYDSCKQAAAFLSFDAKVLTEDDPEQIRGCYRKINGNAFFNKSQRSADSLPNKKFAICQTCDPAAFN